MKRIICFLVLILSVISFVSCSEEDLRERYREKVEKFSFSETHTGKGSLAFTIDGTKVYQNTSVLWWGGRQISYYRKLTEKDQIEIFSLLNNNIFYSIRFVFPSEELKADATIHPDVELKYFSEGNNLQYVIVYDAIINITYCENDIISGRFTLEGEYADSSGKVHIVDVTDGIFDLKRKG